MATWGVIESAGRTVVRIIRERLQRAGLPGVEVRLLTTAAFDDLASTSNPVISVFLYQVSQSTELRNSTMQTRADGTRGRQSLSLELRYLITPWGARPSAAVDDDETATQEEARLLGLVMQAMYDNAELGTAALFEDPATPVWRPGDGLQVVLDSLPVEDHYRIWDASEIGYRLSVTYRLRVAHLDPESEVPGPPVVDAAFGAAP